MDINQKQSAQELMRIACENFDMDDMNCTLVYLGNEDQKKEG